MSAYPEHSSEQTFGDLIAEIWAGKWFVMIGLVLGCAAAFAFVVAAVPHGRAEMILAPASPMDVSVQDSENNQSAQPVPAVSQFIRFENILRGARLAGLMLRDDDIRAGLEKDQSFIFGRSAPIPDVASLSAFIKERVQIDPVGESALRIYAFEHPDPAFAVLFLTRLHQGADGLIRHAMRKEVNERIAYLQEALSQTMNPDHRRALTDLLMEQERLKMLVSIEQPYAAAVIEPASVQAGISWPDIPLVFSGFGVVGAFLGFVIFSVRQAWRARYLDAAAFGPALSRRQSMQEWMRKDSRNNNERPLTGAKKSPPFSSEDAAE